MYNIWKHVSYRFSTVQKESGNLNDLDLEMRDVVHRRLIEVNTNTFNTPYLLYFYRYFISNTVNQWTIDDNESLLQHAKQ